MLTSRTRSACQDTAHRVLAGRTGSLGEYTSEVESSTHHLASRNGPWNSSSCCCREPIQLQLADELHTDSLCKH